MKRFILSLLVICPLYLSAQLVRNLPVEDTAHASLSTERVGSFSQIYDITQPRIDLYLPKGEAFATLLVCPGGAYEYVSVGNEGVYVAQWAQQHHIAVAVLKYRLPAGHEDIPLTDALSAMRMLRDSAAVWHLNPSMIGVMGFSAGGHLAGSLLTKYQDLTTRPNFGVLVYPVLSMEDDTHRKTRRLLLGDDFTEEQIQRWDLKRLVTPSTPPCFVVACQDDKAVPISNSLDFYTALTKHGVSAELLIMPQGGHGFGFQREIPQTALFHQALLQWLQELNN